MSEENLTYLSLGATGVLLERNALVTAYDLPKGIACGKADQPVFLPLPYMGHLVFDGLRGQGQYATARHKYRPAKRYRAHRNARGHTRKEPADPWTDANLDIGTDVVGERSRSLQRMVREPQQQPRLICNRNDDQSERQVTSRSFPIPL